MGNITTICTVTSQETSQFGEKLAAGIVEKWQRDLSYIPHIFCLYGDLGAGKTTFTQGFAKGLGISSRVLSPTFLISKRYATSFEHRYFYHLDIYRMESEGGLESIGLAEILADIRSVIVIEWAEKLQSYLPKLRNDITFSVKPDGIHQIHINTYDTDSVTN